MIRILAIDPGTTQSAWVLYADGTVWDRGIAPNEDVLARLRSVHWAWCPTLVIEMVSSYGMRYVGAETYETCVWIGRFLEAYDHDVQRITRPEVKTHLLGSPRGKDPDVIAALKDRFGGESAKGTKNAPGPLYGVKGDIWAALAVAVTWADTHPEEDTHD